MKVINNTRDVLLAEKTTVADNPLSRMIGLLGRKDFRKGEALIISPCNSIHTFFMGFPIDALFINRENRVIKAISGIMPYRLSPVYFSAHSVIELPAGIIKETSTQEGDTLSFSL